MNLDILPLAITMMAGPQIMSAIIFVTAPKAVRVSAAFIVGVAIATTVGVAIALAVAGLLGDNISLGDPSNKGSIGHIIQYLLVGLLVALAVKNYVRRETVDPPAALHPVPQTRTASHAPGTRLDEHAQLAGEHHRLRRVHRAHPLTSPFCTKQANTQAGVLHERGSTQPRRQG
jgi:hypothetical protein